MSRTLEALMDDIDAVRQWIDSIDIHEGEDEYPADSVSGRFLRLTTLEARIGLDTTNRSLDEIAPADRIEIRVVSIIPGFRGASPGDLDALSKLVEQLQSYADSLQKVPVGTADIRD